MDIKKVKSDLSSKYDKKGYLKDLLKDSSVSASLKSEIRKLLIEQIKDSGQVKLSNSVPCEYHVCYDSISEGLEPIYFWILDFMRSPPPSGKGYEVNKAEENFEASAGSGYFESVGLRAGAMQDRAIKIMGSVNTIVRSIINLLYDLKEFKMRLDTYDELKSKEKDKAEGAELSLRAMWMDMVDIKKGRGSINMMTQELQFVTLRDAFMQAKDEKDAGRMDLNKRVKLILKRKLNEYLKWRDQSEIELRKRCNIEKGYLKTQVDSLKLYTKWARPYLRAAAKLGMKDFNSPDVISAFSNMQMELTLLGKKEVKPESVFESYADIRFGKKVYSCVEVKLSFRTVPQMIRAQSGTQYVHTGFTDIRIMPYVFTSDEVEYIEKQELYDDLDLVENLTEVSLKELQTDLDDIFEEKKPEKEEKKKTELLPFVGVFKGFKKTAGELSGGIKSVLNIGESYEIGKIKEKAKDSALDIALDIIDKYKKAHGMISW